MKDELLRQLEFFEIDQATVEFPFSSRLARENGWSREFAGRVVAEYKRFVWLAMRAGHPVTPSEEIDEAWHLHLCYTRSYWEQMCGKILGKPLHHGPTEGGRAEDEKFADWYARTLESYRLHFGEEPPADIWPLAEFRFRRSSARKVDGRNHWIVSKRKVRGTLVAACVISVPLALAGCSGLLAATDPSGFVCVLFLIGFVALMVTLAKRGGKGGSGCATGGCSSVSSCSSDSGCGSSGCGSSGCGSSGCGSSGCGSSGCGGGCGGGD